jgi:hypothetical protein
MLTVSGAAAGRPEPEPQPPAVEVSNLATKPATTTHL